MLALELNGMGYGETPPPLPIKSGMGDYGNLMENPELASPTTPPPLHQRVKHMITAITCHCETTQGLIVFSKFFKW